MIKYTYITSPETTWDALKEVPQGHPMTVQLDDDTIITGPHVTIPGFPGHILVGSLEVCTPTKYIKGFLSIGWEEPVPKWDGVRVIRIPGRSNLGYFIRGWDGKYYNDPLGDGRTALEISQKYGEVVVLLSEHGHLTADSPGW